MNNEANNNQSLITDYDQACDAVKRDPFNYENLDSNLQNDQYIIELTILSVSNKLRFIELSHMCKLTRKDKIINNVPGLKKLMGKLENKEIVPKLK